MKILMVNKFYYMKGGSETYYFALKRMLEKEGHTVIDFSMKDDRNFDSRYSEYFVDHVDYFGSGGWKSKVQAAGKIVYSFEAKRKFEDLIVAERPDLIHLHLFQHQLSPSILDVIKKYNIPAVYTVHDLKMICLNYKMFHHGHVCEDCRSGDYLQCLKNRCVKDSLLKSSVNVVEGFCHRWHKSYDVIDKIITPSSFYRKKFEEFGVAPDRLVHIPNFLVQGRPEVNRRSDDGKYFLYFGRLSEEKGILTLLKAVEGTEHSLYIVGVGPLAQSLEEYARERRLDRVRFLGYRSGQELTDLVGNAMAVVIPSEWYENGPYAAIEALQLGKPIIGARIGGIPELIRGNGFTFEAGNVEALRSALTEMSGLDAQEYKDMEENSLKLYRTNYTWKAHSRELLQVYAECIEKHKRRKGA